MTICTIVNIEFATIFISRYYFVFLVLLIKNLLVNKTAYSKFSHKFFMTICTIVTIEFGTIFISRYYFVFFDTINKKSISKRYILLKKNPKVREKI